MRLKFSLLLAIVLLYGCQKEVSVQKICDNIRINQLGYYPESVKSFVVADIEADSFELVNRNGEVVYNGAFSMIEKWELSGETLITGTFDQFNIPGNYHIVINDSLISYEFEISNSLFDDELSSAIKSYYFQRASMEIAPEFGGTYQRKAGHMDTACLYDPSTGNSGGYKSSTGGWYDAGDYGKYTGNASLSAGQMMLLVEQFPDIIPDGSLNIPESGNNIGDLWDELIYELNWLLTMQDKDGGVFHKLTARNFSGFIMPSDYDLERLLIGKGTASTLNFAAVITQASRLYKNIDPQWSENALKSAEKAWVWAKNNNNVEFKNPDGIVTGEYGDDYFGDDFYWAATELFIATGNQEYLKFIACYPEPVIHQITNSWKYFIRNNAFHSILENKEQFPELFYNEIRSSHLSLADSVLDIIDGHPYGIGLNHFEWGSNSDILNQAMILCIAHRITGSGSYLDGATMIIDYIFGKNATGYCFLTGYGDKKVMFPHHRPSGADKIVDPIPGFIVGGPNADRQDENDVEYLSEYPAKSFMDVEASYASNEVCLNWNAPAVYVMAYIDRFKGR